MTQINHALSSEGEYDTEVFKQVQQFLTTAQFNTFNYKIPKVSFFFSNGITQALCDKIEPHLSVVVSMM
jgi:hypothetical protein